MMALEMAVCERRDRVSYRFARIAKGTDPPKKEEESLGSMGSGSSSITTSRINLQFKMRLVEVRVHPAWRWDSEWGLATSPLWVP
jgi:hypothetical protein